MKKNDNIHCVCIKSIFKSWYANNHSIQYIGEREFEIMVYGKTKEYFSSPHLKSFLKDELSILGIGHLLIKIFTLKA